MKTPSKEDIDRLILDFITATAQDKLAVSTCGSCAQECTVPAVHSKKYSDLPNADLLKPYTPHTAHVLWNGLLICSKALSADGQSLNVCNDCYASLLKGRKPALSLANDMWVGDVPYQLRNLHIAERLMIAKGFPSAYVVKLYPKKKGSAKWGTESQFYSGMRGNVTTYKMDPVQMASLICDNVLPHRSSVLPAIIGVTFVGPKGFPLHGLPGMFRIRRWRIREALVWLKTNNPLFSDIVISEERLAELPEDGVPEEIIVTAKYSTDVESLNREGESYIPDIEGEMEEGIYLYFMNKINFINLLIT